MDLLLRRCNPNPVIRLRGKDLLIKYRGKTALDGGHKDEQESILQPKGLVRPISLISQSDYHNIA